MRMIDAKWLYMVIKDKRPKKQKIKEIDSQALGSDIPIESWSIEGGFNEPN